MTDTEQYHRAIEEIYAAAPLPEHWPIALDAVAACFDSVGTVLLLPQPNGTSTIVSPALKAAAADYEAWAWKLDFYVPRVLESTILERNACYTDASLGHSDEIGLHPFYTEFRNPHGLGPFLGTAIMPTTDMVAFMTIQGRLSRKSYTEQEIELCSTLGRHVERSLMLTIRLMEAEAREETTAEAFSRLSCGLVALDSTGRITFTNSAAERMIGEWFAIEDGRLACKGQHGQISPVWQADGGSRSLQPPPIPTDPISPLILSAKSGNDRLVLYFLPIGSELPHVIRETFLTSRLLVLAIAVPGGKPDPALLRDVLGLTLGEARLATFVGGGKSPKEAAMALGITEESARTVLKRVFSKTGTSRQSELTALVSRLMLRP